MVAFNYRIGLRYGRGLSIGTMGVGTHPLGIWDQTRWEDPVGPYGFNAFGFNEVQLNDYGDPFDLSTDRDLTGEYRIELRDPSGVLLFKLPDFFDSKWSEQVNTPGSLSFGYLGDADAAPYLAYPNLIYLYRGAERFPERVFIVNRVRKDESEMDRLSVTATGVIQQLAKENLDSYNPGGDTKTVYEILTEFIGEQQLPNKFNLGFIESSIGNAEIPFSVSRKTIYQALMELQGLFGGFLYATPHRRIVWRSQIGNHEGHVIRFGKNAERVVRDLDWTAVETRLHATADTYAGGTVSVTVDDASAQAVFGVIEGYFKSIPVASEAELEVLARKELARRSAPKKSLDVGVIDLSHTEKYDFSFEALALDPGSSVRIVSEESGFDEAVMVYSVTRSLDDPLAVQMKVVDRNSELAEGNERSGQDFLDAVLRLVEYVNRAERG